MIWRPFTIDRQVLLDSLHDLEESPDEPIQLVMHTPEGQLDPPRMLQVRLRGEVVVFDIVDGEDLDAVLARDPKPEALDDGEA